MAENISTTLARFALELKYEQIPAAAIHEAKRFIIDSLGCALAAVENEDMERAATYVRALGGAPQAGIIGSRERAAMPDAAFMNSLLIRAIDYNDIYWEQDPSHPSDIIPAALAPAQFRHLSGRELLVAVVVAYELEMRFCHAASPGVRERGWHHASLTQFVSPLVAARALGMTLPQAVAACGISGSSHFTLGGVVAGKLSNMKNTADPMATEAGVRAAMLASTGYTGPEALFEGKEGVFHVISNTKWLPEEISRNLGTEFLITRCGYKAFPTEALTHQPISAAMSIMAENRLLPHHLDVVRVETTTRGADILSDPSKYQPDTKETADHSLPYCVATALVKGNVLPRDFSDTAIFDADVRAMLPRIKVVADPEIDALFPKVKRARVTVRTRDGHTFQKTCDHAKGSPENPLDDTTLLAKYLANAEHALGETGAKRLAGAIWELDSLADVDELCELWAR